MSIEEPSPTADYDGAKENKPNNNPLRTVMGACNGWPLTVVIVLVVMLVLSPSSIGLQEEVSSTTTTTTSTTEQKVHDVVLTRIPECETAPWKPNEDLVGNCPGELQPSRDPATTAVECAASCCSNPECSTWQFRRDTGCLQGPDVRIGQEKDGPAAYCSAHPPFRWKGQYVKDGRKETECSVDSWHPDEQPGQCFGLGDKRQGIESAADCMKACCADEACGAWQFAEDLGCFYDGDMHTCQTSDDPIVFENFVGRRKKVSSRTYTGEDGEPARNWQPPPS